MQEADHTSEGRMGQAGLRGGGQDPGGGSAGCARARPGCPSEGPDGSVARCTGTGTGQARHATTTSAATTGEVASLSWVGDDREPASAEELARAVLASGKPTG